MQSADHQFGQEAEMATPVKGWLEQKGLLVKSEFSLPWGICDFVGVALNSTRIQRRLAYGQTKSIGSTTRLHILERIPDCQSGTSISIQRLQSEFSTHLSPAVLSAEIDFLIRNKFVLCPRRNYLQKRNGWAPLHRQIVAVENKLTRVSEVVRQACANRAFATYSYVALPGCFALEMANARKNAFADNGIGLLGVWRNRCREIITPPKTNLRQNAVMQAHVVERFWRTKGNLP